MKIVVIGGYAPSLVNSRGPLLKRLVALGHEVHALAPHHMQDVGPQLEALGVEYHMIPLQRRGLNPFADIGSLLHLKQIMHRIDPELVFSYNFKPVVYGSMAARMAWVDHRKRVYGLVTGLGYAFTEDKGLKRRILFNIAKGMYKSGLGHCDGVIFQNSEDEAFFKRLGAIPEYKRTLVVNGSGVDLEQFAPVPLPENPTFLCLMGLARPSGVGAFAEAAGKLKTKYPSAVFRVAGPVETGKDGVTPAELSAWKEGGAVEILGDVEDIRPLLGGAGVFVLPTDCREGTPRSVLAAMAMGRPVITTDVPGCRESVVEGENGFLVPPNDTEAVADAMERFLTDSGRISAMGASSRLLAENRFDAEKINDDILSFMELV